MAVKQRLVLSRHFHRWVRQPSAGFTFGAVSFACNVNWQWKANFRCESILVAKPGYALEQALPFLFHCNKRALKTPDLPKLECGKEYQVIRFLGINPSTLLISYPIPKPFKSTIQLRLLAYTCCNLVAN